MKLFKQPPPTVIEAVILVGFVIVVAAIAYVTMQMQEAGWP